MQSELQGKHLLRRGKVRDVYDEGNELLVVATDRISAFDRIMPVGIDGKGVALTKLSEFWFIKTDHVFKNHYLSRYDERSLRVKKAQRIDIEWIVRAYLYGSAWRAYTKGARQISGVTLPGGLQLAEELPEIVLTPTTKSDKGHDEELSKAEALNRKLVTKDEWKELEEATYGLFEYYKKEAGLKGIIIPDFKLEYGRVKDDLIQIDEPPTHDSARFWAKNKYKIGEKQEKHCLDKEFLRDYLLRKNFSGDGDTPPLPDLVLSQISLRCRGAWEVLSGAKTMESLGLLSVDEVLALGSQNPGST